MFLRAIASKSKTFSASSGVAGIAGSCPSIDESSGRAARKRRNWRRAVSLVIRPPAEYIRIFTRDFIASPGRFIASQYTACGRLKRISMNSALVGLALSALVFIGTVSCLDIGFRLGSRSRDGTSTEGTGAIEAAGFALLGLLLGFSFAGGITPLDARRHLIV